jgi:uncharacterized protein YuzE
MTIEYDKTDDRLRIILRDAPVAHGDEPRPDFHFYYDAAGEVVALDIDNATEHVDTPAEMTFRIED